MFVNGLRVTGVDLGWVIVEGGHSACLTDHGRQRASKSRRHHSGR